MTRVFVTVGLAILGAVAQADIVGKVKGIDQSGITLDIGPKHPWGSTITAQRRGEIIRQLPSGSLIRLRLEAGKVVSARPTRIQPGQIKITKLQAMKPYSGGFKFEEGHQFWGYIPKSVGVNHGSDTTVYELNKSFDSIRFKFLTMDHNDIVRTRLHWRLDGGEVITRETSTTSLIEVLIDLRGVRSLQIWADNRTDNFQADPNFIIDAELLQLPESVPVLSSPASKESVRSDEELRWGPVPDSLGYRVELECIRLYSTDDALKQRFFTVQTNSETRVVKLSDLNLPLGEYRWRVHSLDDIGVMGQLNEWWPFTLTK